MDLDAVLRELFREWKRLNRAISRLEAQQREIIFKPRRRGRQSMGPEERAEVSRRMKDFWQARRERQQHDNCV